jgi:quercetin dioxygenase-like cupin family protein
MSDQEGTRESAWVKTVSSKDLAPLAGLQGRWGRYLKPSAESRGMIFGLGELLEGEVAGWHEHPEPELFFVLEGRGEARWKADGQERRAELVPGVAFYKHGGISHQMVNLGSQPLRGVFFKVAAV